MAVDYELFELGDLKLQRGGTLRNAKLAYVTYGTLNAEKSNVVVFPTWFAGSHRDNEWLIGAGKALDPEKYFIIVPNLFGNGLSSSPSNTPAPFDGPRFPNVTLADNVHAQRRLLTEKFGIQRVRLVTGSSMGAMQTFHWAALYPDLVDAIAPFVGAAKCSRHNAVFIEGLKAALTLDPDFKDGWYTTSPKRGLRTMGRIYAGWAFSQSFYRNELDIKTLGFSSLEDFIVGFWEGAFLGADANNLLAMLWTWQNGDISDNDLYNGDMRRALGAITAKAFVMPGQTDLYFTVEDCEAEVRFMPRAELVTIPSIWGHFAGGPGTNPEDAKFINDKITELLSLA